MYKLAACSLEYVGSVVGSQFNHGARLPASQSELRRFDEDPPLHLIPITYRALVALRGSIDPAGRRRFESILSRICRP